MPTESEQEDRNLTKKFRDKVSGMNGSIKGIAIGGGITATALITWIFAAGGRDVELANLKTRMDKVEPIVVSLQIKQAGLESTVMTKLENISNQIEDLQREIRTLKKP